MAELVWLDLNGNEVLREHKGRGRPPRGAVRRDDGNFYVQVDEASHKIMYIELDSEGQVISKKLKGRGRPRPGFAKAADGNWYRRL